MLNFAAIIDKLTTRAMKKTFYLLLTVALLSSTAASAYELRRVSVHDPSVVWEPTTQFYYIFGTHRGVARSKNMMTWTGISVPWGLANENGVLTNRDAASNVAYVNNMTKTVTVGGEEKAISFDAQAWSAAYGNYFIDGNLWAPDVIYNKKMGKWCMYMSVNGPKWNSSIVLLTADKITGPYVYQAPVVITGFNVQGAPSQLSYKKTDLELVIGTQATLPSRYNMGAHWGNRWPHAIDPCVFYDEEGTLWMSYGSWSGGIWILQLNAETGLRDYDVKYPSTGGNTDAVTFDPYFGKKIAGGRYVSGEGSYIEYIGGYYFLFVSNGGLEQAAGYQMRVFRSAKPNGPYVDTRNVNAIYADYRMNYGPGSDTRGVNIFGAYGLWGDQLKNDGERAQGHNSIIAAEDGRTYLVYHTRFQNGGEGHQVRVHQVFQNENGWLVAAPFEYTGEKVTSADIATTQQVATPKITGTYQLLIHRYGLDHKNKEQVTPEEIILHADGTITGDRTGTWQIAKEGTSYINVKLGSTTYKGVMVEQTMEPNQNKKTVAFTALANNGVTAWGYRSGDDPDAPATAVSSVSSSLPAIADTPWHDMQGRTLSAPTRRGLYIQNGKKIVIK